MDLVGPLVVAAIVHRFDSQLGCPADEIKRVAGFVDEINKLPHVISIRKDSLNALSTQLIASNLITIRTNKSITIENGL